MVGDRESRGGVLKRRHLGSTLIGVNKLLHPQSELAAGPVLEVGALEVTTGGRRCLRSEVQALHI